MGPSQVLHAMLYPHPSTRAALNPEHLSCQLPLKELSLSWVQPKEQFPFSYPCMRTQTFVIRLFFKVKHKLRLV